MSELQSLQEKEAQAYLQDEAMMSMMPTVSALLGKLNFIINGDVPPSPTPQPAEDDANHEDYVRERETPQRRTSPRRSQPPQPEHETLENEHYGYNNFAENRNNNNRPAKRLSRAPVPVSEVNRSVASLLKARG